MKDRLRPSAHAALACLAVAIAEIAWTYGTGFATAQESLWIIASWGLVAIVLVGVARVLFPRPESSARVRFYLLVPLFILALRGQTVTSGASGVLLNVVILGGLVCLVFLATRRPVSLGRIWLYAVFCGAAGATRLAFASIESITMRAVLGAHPGRVAEVGTFALCIFGLALLTWVRKWDGRSLGLFCLLPSLLAAGAFIARVAVRPPTPPESVESAPNRPTVVVIVLDTLRRDGLSSLGGPQGMTPNLDAFASSSTLYTNAYTNGTYSLTGHASLFTGLLPGDHGAHPPSLPVRPTVRLLAEELRDLGYSPYGYSANPIYLAPWTGLQRGFRHFYSEGRDRFGYYPTASPLFRLARIRPTEQSWWPALDFLEAVRPIVATQGTALFLNLMESHGPRPDFDDLDERSAYYATVKRLDETLSDFLKTLAGLPNAVVVITSDHGEFLGEHGLSGHSTGHLYEAGLRIPLIVRFPGQRVGRTDTRQVSLMDVATLVRAALAGTADSEAILKLKDPRVIAETWTPLVVGSTAPLGGSPTARAIYLGHYKVIEHYNGSFEMYDIEVDPAEQSNLVTTDPAFAKGMITMFQGVVPPLGNRATMRPPAEVPPEVLERMRALGYIK